MILTLAEAAIGAGAVLEAPSSLAHAGSLAVTGYSIDSRTVAPGELFFAVRGEHLDGHDFVAAALARGAAAAVVSRTRVASLRPTPYWPRHCSSRTTRSSPCKLSPRTSAASGERRS